MDDKSSGSASDSAPADRNDPFDRTDPFKSYGMPELGLREFWYPVLAARKLGRRPKSITALGEELVLFRDGDRVFALDNRCPHRGARLSLGACRFAATISCPYHGWTFNGKGDCVARIMEGPDSKIPARARVKAYSAIQRNGLIWIYLGDREPPAFEADVPNTIADKEKFFTITASVDYACNWRILADNWTNEHHGPYVHGNAPELVLQPVPPFNLTLSVVDHGDGRGMGVRGEGGVNAAEFPGLGRFPASSWHRFLKPHGRGVRGKWHETRAAKDFGVQTPTASRLPGMVIVARPGAEYFLIQWALPLDAQNTRLFNINCFRRMGRWREIRDRVHYALYRGWAHDWIFSGQDKKVVESIILGPELLSRTDVGLVAWRRFVGRHARENQS